MIYLNFINFLKNRAIELMGLSLIFGALLFAISFFSYSPNDPTFVYGADVNNINNFLGIYGGIVADFLLQSFGLTSFLILITIISWGLHLIIRKEVMKRATLRVVKYSNGTTAKPYPRNYVALMAILASMFLGRRYRNEILNLKWSQIDLDDNKPGLGLTISKKFNKDFNIIS
tara:strand:- start:2 stop:520 length:519 start_codon:yes stop_codon:yes gene_type:complete